VTATLQLGPALVTDVVFAIGRDDFSAGIFHQTTHRRAVLEAQRVADLVHGDLGQPFIGVAPAARPPLGSIAADYASRCVEVCQPQHAPIGDIAVCRRDIAIGETQDACSVAR